MWFGTGDAAPGAGVDRERVGAVRQLDRVAALIGDVDPARGGDGVALQAQQVLVAIAVAQHDGQGDREEDHGRAGDASDGDDESAPHGTSNR